MYNQEQMVNITGHGVDKYKQVMNFQCQKVISDKAIKWVCSAELLFACMNNNNHWITLITFDLYEFERVEET